MNKFSAGSFCFFMGFYVFNGIQASCAGLFAAKKKEAHPARTRKINWYKCFFKSNSVIPPTAVLLLPIAPI
ncbi:hypothetical protein [Pedobacter borealis]|uniref:hypothetical protein n=1 Tax=Pedobacter borealis TaxID=475254 RepID=UPI0012F912B0|nr:hypothetical protein [Pedobacter borealis]